MKQISRESTNLSYIVNINNAQLWQMHYICGIAHGKAAEGRRMHQEGYSDRFHKKD